MKPIYILKLDVPHKDLSQNSRVHWSVKAKLVRSHRQKACLFAKICFKDILTRNLFEPYRSATIGLKFYFKDNRRRDHRNFEGRCKSYDDGIVDSGILIDDDKLTWQPTEFIINSELEHSYLEYHFYKLEY